MLIKVLAIGRMRDVHWQAKAEEFAKWLSPYAKIELVELRDADRAREGEQLLRALRDERGFVVVLSEDGEAVSSPELAARLGRIDRKIVFVIGGPDGLTPEVKARADWLWSLSKLTFTHEMARVLLFEQLFRAVSIAHGGKYQR